MHPQQGGGLYSPESASRRKSASSEKVLVLVRKLTICDAADKPLL